MGMDSPSNRNLAIQLGGAAIVLSLVGMGWFSQNREATALRAELDTLREELRTTQQLASARPVQAPPDGMRQPTSAPPPPVPVSGPVGVPDTRRLSAADAGARLDPTVPVSPLPPRPPGAPPPASSLPVTPSPVTAPNPLPPGPTAPPPPGVPPPHGVEGCLGQVDANAVRLSVENKDDDLRACVESARAQGVDIPDVIGLHLEVGPAGRIQGGWTLPALDPGTTACLVGVASQAPMPAVSAGRCAMAVLPLRL